MQKKTKRENKNRTQTPASDQVFHTIPPIDGLLPDGRKGNHNHKKMSRLLSVSVSFFGWHHLRVRHDMASAFGAVLKKHRLKKAISQEALAEKADIHPTHVSLIERFERNPSLNVAKALAR